MTAILLDGKHVSQTLLNQLAQDLNSSSTKVEPRLVVILVGANPASEIYVSRKIKVAPQVGIASELHRFPEDVPVEQLCEHLLNLNADPSCHAILLQLPLPAHLDADMILGLIAADKDVDGFHPENMGKLVMGIEPPALPCTPAGMMQLLDAYKINPAGKRAAVVGRSNIVGKPITMMLTQRDATVTLCHSRTPDLASIVKDCDIIVAAAGRPGLIGPDAVKPGAVILDVGINRLADGKITGDVDFDAVKDIASYITPVPGGVGPMTIAMLMVNTVRLFQHQQGKPLKNLILST